MWELVTNPVTWTFAAAFVAVLAAFVAAIGGYVTVYRQREQARDIKGWLMGGDSWVYFVPLRTREQKLAFFVRQVGDPYPAYDVIMRIQDELKETHPGDPIYVAPVIKAGRGFDYYEPRQLIFSQRPARGESRRLLLEITMRSGTIVVQRVQFWEADGHWRTSSKDITKNGVPMRAGVDFPDFLELSAPKESGR